MAKKKGNGKDKDKKISFIRPFEEIRKEANDELNYAKEANVEGKLSISKYSRIQENWKAINVIIDITIPTLEAQKAMIEEAIAITKEEISLLQDNPVFKWYDNKWNSLMRETTYCYLHERETTFFDSLSDEKKEEYNRDKKTFNKANYPLESERSNLRNLYELHSEVEGKIETSYNNINQLLCMIRGIRGKQVEVTPPVIRDLEVSKKKLAKVECSIAEHPFKGRYSKVARSQKDYEKLSDYEVRQYLEFKSLLKERDKLQKEVNTLEKEAMDKGKIKGIVNGRSPFQQLMDSFISLENEGKQNTKEYSDLLISFAVAIVLSVLNKLKNVGTGLSSHEKALKDKIEGGKEQKKGKKTVPDKEYWGKKRRQPSPVEVTRKIRSLMKGVNEGKANFFNLEYYESFSRTFYYDKKGRLKSKFEDKHIEVAITHLLGYNYDDSWDLVNSAIVLIKEEIKKYREREGSGKPLSLEIPYTYETYKSHVLIKDKQAEKILKETSPVKEIFRGVRRLISSEKGIRVDINNGYLYIPKVVNNNEGLDEILYIRAGKYSDFASYNEYNMICSDISEKSYINFKKLIDSWKLAPAQKRYLDYRIRGYGYKAIGTLFHVSHNAIINSMKGIQKKAIESGLLERKHNKEHLARVLYEESMNSLVYDIYTYHLFNGQVRSDSFYRWVKKKEYTRLFNQLDYKDYTEGRYKLVTIPEGLTPAINRGSKRNIDWKAYQRETLKQRISALIDRLVSDLYEQALIRKTWKGGRVEIPKAVRTIEKKEVKGYEEYPTFGVDKGNTGEVYYRRGEKPKTELTEKQKLEKAIDKIEAMLREGKYIPE